ncbi:cytoplasmic dynein 2 heavy chain 1 [Schistocerca piceifrons]|uniref:cytoplasmic dynein 2 heavy chain 1 n=1 Tax=Schistocerca piceifrons TaxID=274613 RepID=UPI001F5F7557|nr:cytoplasmic dynein 2 heavy chain 1 [Schistocerca piceifrons]
MTTVASSPLVTFYYTIKEVYTPILLQAGNSSNQIDSSLQDLITKLQDRLKCTLQKIGKSVENDAVDNVELIVSPVDEAHYWSYMANNATNNKLQEKCVAFFKSLEPLAKEFSMLDSLPLQDGEDVTESAFNILDDLWKLDDYQYPQTRMEHLFCVTGNCLIHFIQKKLRETDLWKEPFISVEELVNTALSICRNWINSCERLTSLFWANYSPHPWHGKPYLPTHVMNLASRLEEILHIRKLHRQLSRLLSAEELQELLPGGPFNIFCELNVLQCNPYTDPLWQTAVAQYHRILKPVGERVAGKLRNQISRAGNNVLELLQEFVRCRELIQQPDVSHILTPEREAFLAALKEYIAATSADFSSRNHSGYERIGEALDMPSIVANICWLRHMENKVCEIQNISSIILHDLSGYSELHTAVSELIRDVKEQISEQFDNWTRDVGSAVHTRKLSLQTDQPVVHFEGRLMRVNYDYRLVSLIHEVRQLSVLGYKIPSHVQQTAELAASFMRQAKALEQIANFHNTIGDRMIPSQRPMMLVAARELERLVQEQGDVTWGDSQTVEGYLSRLQAAVERLSRENNILAAYHCNLRNKVLALMESDSLRYQHKMKEILRDIRDIFDQVDKQKFVNMKSWRLHWDYQLYKAIEYHYQLGLETLNDHLSEISIELIFRQQKLQFQPPMEEIRMKYYGQLKRFLALPNNFRGTAESSENSIFPVIIQRNARRFGGVFARAEQQFEKLEKVKERWQPWVALGTADIDHLTREYLHTADDWDQNFRTSKTHGQQIAKLPRTEEKVGCFSVSVKALCSELELHNRRYWDAIVASLQVSILTDAAKIQKFASESVAALGKQPQSIDEIADATRIHAEIKESAPQMIELYEESKKKNKVLAVWTKERIEEMNQTASEWANFQFILDNHQFLIEKQVENVKQSLETRTSEILEEMEKFRLRWEQARPRETDLQDGGTEILLRGLDTIRAKRAEWKQLMEIYEKLVADCLHFAIQEPKFNICEEVEADIGRHETLWSLFEEFNSGLQEMSKSEWIIFRSRSYVFEDFLQNWEQRLKSGVETSGLTVKLLQEIDTYKIIIPAIKYVRGEMFSEKHWKELFILLGITDKLVENLTFGDILDVRDNISRKIAELKELNNRAASEIAIRKALGELDVWEVEARFSLIEHADSQGQIVTLIKDFKDILNKIGDNQCLLQSIKNSPNYSSFTDRASIWERRLTELDEYLNSLAHIQRKWVYLEPIFGAGTLSHDLARFQRVDRDFRLIMSDVARDPRVVMLCKVRGLSHMLARLRNQLSLCQNSLNTFLEEKRSAFPRFYFLSDDDLLEVLGQSTRERVIQAHLRKLFAGVHTVSLDSSGQLVTAVHSLEGEIVTLKKAVSISNDVEKWLSDLLSEIQSTLQRLLTECLLDIHQNTSGADPNKYPAQILCLAENIHFTEKCEKAISSGTLPMLHNSLKLQLKSYTTLGQELVDDSDSCELALKLKALMLDTIRNIDVVEQLINAGVSSLEDWCWQKQLRFYSQNGDSTVVRMVDAEFKYTFEYQGSTLKLVHTPLTDKCYLTLTQAMRMGLGGNPYGPAGTGKTESVKALGGLMGRQVLVFNCDEAIDVTSMARMFTGIVKCGAWGCFDEFNRLDEATLSAVSLQIQPIQMALKLGLKTVKILDEEVTLNPHCGIFVTLNPAGKGYGGRQHLPDNLKQLFRPVVMSRPDNELIAEVFLQCEGFQFSRSLGHKLVEVFNLARKLLSKQQHYDWGLRALKTILGGCGAAIRAHQREKGTSNNSSLSESDETQLVVSVLRLNTASKLTFADCKKFDALVQDMFPGTEFVESTGKMLKEALKTSFSELGLHFNERQEKKCLEVYEQLQQRMGVVLMGPSGSGKTTICHLLKMALGKLSQPIKQYTMNPKAMPRTQFLGQIDIDTRQWNDGVLTLAAQHVYSEMSDQQSWIVCDGDVDPEWVESLNSVLDDNRLLTLPSGWRIQFGPNVNFIFETHDLSNASPATISRMGMVFFSEEDIDVKGLVAAWLETQSDDCIHFLSSYMDDYFYKGIQWVLQNGEAVVPFSLIGLVKNGLSHLAGVTSKSEYALCLVRGLGGNLTCSNREVFAKEVFSWLKEFAPDGVSPLRCYYDAHRDCLDAYSAKCVASDSDSETDSPLILTPDVRATIDVLEPWLQMGDQHPFLLIGPQGSGKSTILQHCFQKLRATDVATIHCSAHITPAHVLQKLSQVCMLISTTTGRAYRPRNSERLVLYFKDLNLAAPDKWGTSMLISFLQQILTYKGFYDDNLEWVGLEQVHVVASLVGGIDAGRHPLSPRFTSVIRIHIISYPAKEDLKSIYGIYLSRTLSMSSHPVWHSLSKISALASSMVKIYQDVKLSFQQNQQKNSHYIFTPCDLTHCCMSLARYELPPGDNTADYLLEILVYETLRLYCDRLTSDNDRKQLDSIVNKVLQTDWNRELMVERISDTFYVTAASVNIASSISSKSHLGKPLGKIGTEDWAAVVQSGISILGREGHNLNLLILPEVLQTIASSDRILSAPCGSLVLAGQAGIGRRATIQILSALHGVKLIIPNMTKQYDHKNFCNDLKEVMHMAGVSGEQVFLLLEDCHIQMTALLNMVNTLLLSGEVPGLYTRDELEAVVSSLRDVAAQENYVGTTSAFFAQRVQRNLHVVLMMDIMNPSFSRIFESNPALHKKCSILWLESWSRQSLRAIPQMLLSRDEKFESVDTRGTQTNSGIDEKLLNGFAAIHEQASEKLKTPMRYLHFVQTFLQIYNKKYSSSVQQQERLKIGVMKLTEAKNVVDSLKSEADIQQKELAEKQAKANTALQIITETMHNANSHKGQLVMLKEQSEKKNQELTIRKKEIDAELAEIEPVIQQARAAVGNIKSESLSEIRSLRAPPEIIRDILECVLSLMGIRDTSWNNMKNFLAKRGVKEEIRTFDVRSVTPESRAHVERLIQERKESLEPANAKRASSAAAPLAAWVIAVVRYSKTLEKVRPLEREQIALQSDLEAAEKQVTELSGELTGVDHKVAELRQQLNLYTREAAELEIKLSHAHKTIASAEGLLQKLGDEFQRWTEQLTTLSEELINMPLSCLLAAAFVCYLGSEPEDSRQKYVSHWQKIVGWEEAEHFSLTDFLSTEQQCLVWHSQGLPPDTLSLQNGLLILQASLRPLLLDPTSVASCWLQNYLKDEGLETVTQHSSRFYTSLEMAVRFGKTLLIEEADSIDPVLYPILRRELTNQGGDRKAVQLGSKLVDFDDRFQLFLTTRNPDPDLPPDAEALITVIDFKTTKTGLSGQLLAVALQHEKPHLETRRSDLLRQEEDFKMKLEKLQEELLQRLVCAEGDILQNEELLASLNETKASSAAVRQSLVESSALQHELNKECEVYKPYAEFGSNLFFVINSLGKVNSMYKFSVASFKRLFQKALDMLKEENDIDQRQEHQKKNLLLLTYQQVSRSLFKSDRLMFALHLIHSLFPSEIPDDEWSVFLGQHLSVIRADSGSIGGELPDWISKEQLIDVYTIKTVLPKFWEELHLEDHALWSAYYHSIECETNLPSKVVKKISPFQRVLVMQALRPDRLLSAMSLFTLQVLGLSDLSPPAISLKQLYSESLPYEPILLITSPGADPSEELRELASATVGEGKYKEMVLCANELNVALEALQIAADQGNWLCLKNLHLATACLPDLEKYLRTVKGHENFRLWLSTEQHLNFSSVLAQSCLKMTYESPQGLKRNIQRTLATWGPEFFSGPSGNHAANNRTLRTGALFVLAWFHAIIQERRSFIPQGWTSYYEFGDADLRVATDMIDRLCQAGQREIKWEFIHGLCEDAIYGGRVDNVYDMKVLESYLKEFFSPGVLIHRTRSLGSVISVPPSSNYYDYYKAIHILSDTDKPTYFGLPSNIERSWQKTVSKGVISELKKLILPTEGSHKFDRDKWQKHIAPILNLWKKLNQNSGLIQTKPLPQDSEISSPVVNFVLLEHNHAITLVHFVHQSLARLSKVMRAIALPSKETEQTAIALISHKVPESWQNLWCGPKEPSFYLHSLVSQATAVGHWANRSSDLLREPLDLGDLFEPEAFLAAVKQQTARENDVAIDDLRQVTSWNQKNVSSKMKVCLCLKGLQIEGAVFSGTSLTPCSADAPDASAAPICTLTWMTKSDYGKHQHQEYITLPLYLTSARERVITTLDVPCRASDHNIWIKAGTCFFIKK